VILLWHMLFKFSSISELGASFRHLALTQQDRAYAGAHLGANVSRPDLIDHGSSDSPQERRGRRIPKKEKMKLLTTNFLTCAVKACKTSPLSFPLHFKDATLERTEIDFNPLFIRNILPRVNWDALNTTATELGLQALVPERNPADAEGWNQSDRGGAEDMEIEGDRGKGEPKNDKDEEEVLKKLHNLLLETGVVEGKLVCGNCGFEYPIKDGVGNFLLPAHLV